MTSSSKDSVIDCIEYVDLSTTTATIAIGTKRVSEATIAAVPTSDVINLCDDDDDKDDKDDNVNRCVHHDNPRKKRQKKKHHDSDRKEITPPPDAIVVVDDNDEVPTLTSKGVDVASIDQEALYKQSLGPIRFDFVEKLKYHVYTNTKRSISGAKISRLYQELLEYKLNLPIALSSSIFVRAQEGRLDLIRALITGPEGTPYHNGCFLFDIHLTDYPQLAPKVKFLTTGGGTIRFNPNLYECGKVCLSLLGTWSGPGWVENKSTLLQVLISIQGLIMVPEPYYNEPGYASFRNQTYHRQKSDNYTRNIRKFTLQYAIEEQLDVALSSSPTGPNVKVSYLEFHPVIVRHFCYHSEIIQKQMQDWVDQDPSLKQLVHRIRNKLDRIVQNYSNV